MYFKIYLDSLFVLQFVMNLSMLALVNQMLRQKVSLKRSVAGALAGAVLSVVPMILPLHIYVRMVCSFILSILSMVIITFSVTGIKVFGRIMSKVGISTLLLGGLSLFILRGLPKEGDACMGLAMVLAVVGLAFMCLRKTLGMQVKEEVSCKVTLFGEENVEINALIDTGNHLTEPISGKPVSVLEKSVFERLYGKNKQNFRVIPYHSVGRRQGIMEGYLLQRIVVETQDCKKEYEGVYVGISEELLTDANVYKMILNPKVLE